jgi:enoyl-CoA hydratase/carnithine racemase
LAGTWRFVLSAAALTWIERPADGPASLVLGAPKGNALTPELLDSLEESVVALAAEEDVAVVVRSATKGAFMVGGDVDLFLDWVDRGCLAERWSALAARAGCVFQRLRELAAVKIAVVEGAAVGGGLELLAACDHRIAVADALLGFPEVRFGVYPAAGTVGRLAELVGRSWALRLILGGKLVTAAEAHSIGLVDELVDHGNGRSRAAQLAEELAPAGASVLRAVRAELAGSWAPDRTEFVMRGLLTGLSAQDLKARVLEQRNARRASGR